MHQAVRWGAFTLTRRIDGLNLQDPHKRLWRVAFSGEVAPIFANWYVAAAISHLFAEALKNCPRTIRLQREATRNKWRRQSLRFAHSLPALDPLRRDVLSLLEKYESDRYGLVADECLIKHSKDSGERHRVAFVALLWAFDQFRRVCCDMDSAPSPTPDGLDFLLREVPARLTLPQHVSLPPHGETDVHDDLPRRIQRFQAEHIRRDRTTDLMETVLRNVIVIDRLRLPARLPTGRL